MLKAGKYTDPSSANTYYNHNHVQYELAYNFLVAYGHLVRGPVIDIGSGDGKVSYFVKSHFAVDVTGVDVSSDRVQFAIERYGDEKLHFIEANVIDLGYHPTLKGAQFETAVSFNVLHHVPKKYQLQAMCNIRNVLSNDGIALIIVPSDDSSFERDIEKVIRGPKWSSYFADFDINEVRTYENPSYYISLCYAAGFKYVESVHQDIGWPQQQFCVKGLANFMRGWLPHIVHLKSKLSKQPDDVATMTEQFLHEVAEACLESIADGNLEKRGQMNRILAATNRNAFFARSSPSATVACPNQSTAISLNQQNSTI